MEEMVYQSRPEKKILYKDTYRNIDFIIVSYGTHPCAYIRIPENSKYYKKDYMDINESFPVHGGLTYSDDLCHIGVKEGFWYGWDYNHYGDYSGFHENNLFNYGSKSEMNLKQWTTKEIYEEVKEAINYLIANDTEVV